jgi:hypothetical protein
MMQDDAGDVELERDYEIWPKTAIMRIAASLSSGSCHRTPPARRRFPPPPSAVCQRQFVVLGKALNASA